MDATWGRGGFGSEWDVAVELAQHLADGGDLPVIPSLVLLDAGEGAHADLSAYGWRFHGVDVVYEDPQAVAFGGLATFAVVAVGTGAARRRARAEAERLAAPQWRPLGDLRVLATDRRLLVLHEGAWASVWYTGIRQMLPSLKLGRMELLFEDDPPYALAGPWVPYLAVVMAACLGYRLGPDTVAATLTNRP